MSFKHIGSKCYEKQREGRCFPLAPFQTRLGNLERDETGTGRNRFHGLHRHQLLSAPMCLIDAVPWFKPGHTKQLLAMDGPSSPITHPVAFNFVFAMGEPLSGIPMRRARAPNAIRPLFQVSHRRCQLRKPTGRSLLYLRFEPQAPSSLSHTSAHL
ncbi:uncharacterized protein EI90DRAFT_3038676 [Cantharellus anzutake]|uniref:uncharacterized protein n=1 Tax=Cantharellus anzutake TaxID=1750568 RepID=UPI001908AE98|nr:uncharacterized protein EI90DRAFT_3038676 [Cantharellus anzutake]KAF8339973.1 hypothetical protein EI90DRAFT_3038676 [Cantharellus anzutake]